MRQGTSTASKTTDGHHVSPQLITCMDIIRQRIPLKRWKDDLDKHRDLFKSNLEKAGVQLLRAANYDLWCIDLDTDQTSTEQTCGCTDQNEKKYAQHHVQGQKREDNVIDIRPMNLTCHNLETYDKGDRSIDGEMTWKCSGGKLSGRGQSKTG